MPVALKLDIDKRAKEMGATTSQLGSLTVANRTEIADLIRAEAERADDLETKAIQQYLLRLHVEAALIHNRVCRVNAVKDGAVVEDIPVAAPPAAQ